jgi:hypothetical protein
MSFDTSRFTFNPWNNYSGVVMEQGRVQLDSDWNESLAELLRRIQAGTLDIMGQAVYPATTPFAFQITVTTDASGVNHVNIGPGRMYVDGLLAENHGAQSTAVWDSALAELSGSPQPPAASPTGAIDFTAQPYYPNAKLPSGSGPFLAYLDVWTRPVTYLEDTNLMDPAVNVDTTGRLQTVWQVKLASVQAATCSSRPWPGPSIGQLTNGYSGSGASGPCCLSSGADYTGLENQFYRAEIHQPGTPAAGSTYPAAAGTATFKWSRDNASVETGVTAIQQVTNSIGNNAAQLTVLSLGRDQVLGFSPGNWIELIDDDLELNGQPGELHLIDTVDFAGKTITLVDLLGTPSDFPVNSSNQTTASRHTRIRRWDQSGQIYQVGATPGSTSPWVDLGAAGSTGDIPVPPPGTTLIMESGITVTFGPNGSTQFNTGDFWNFAARANTGQVDPLTAAPPRGIHHHYAPLSVVTFTPPGASDCRTQWPPTAGEGGCGCCTVTVGDGQITHGDYTSIQAAINSLTNGGEVCILPGRYFENVFIQGLQDVVIRGCGDQTRVASAALAPGYQPPGSTSKQSATAIPAVFSIGASQHITLCGFAVEAAPGEAGILIDGTNELIVTQQPLPGSSINANDIDIIVISEGLLGDFDITVKEMVITASTMPAILAKRARILKISENRIVMANVRSTYPSVWMSGEDIEFVRNWVTLQNAATLRELVPASVFSDLLADAKKSGSSLQTSGIRHAGGIQIAGPSDGVLVAENQILGGLHNGITLGGYSILDANGGLTRYTTGVSFELETDCTKTGTLQSPTTFPRLQGSSVVVSGLLEDITIDRNTIEEFGLCGIGPVGFFNLLKTLEVVAIEGLKITSNTITKTLQRNTDSILSFNAGYGAVCLTTVEDLVIRDNVITDFGARPGIGVAGIFLLHGETTEISRNQVVDNRDWNDSSAPDQTGDPAETMGAISIVMATPPTLESDLTGFRALAVFEPGLPALRIQENVVRVPLGQALEVLGFGPFAISDNHFSCGGNIPGSSSSTLQCVEILNMGTGIELVSSSAFSQSYGLATSFNPAFSANVAATSSCGSVIFTDNMCQLELREVPQTGFGSVLIASLDHLTFSNNHCWLDASGKGLIATGQGMFVDAFLLGGTLNAIGNRFQEAQNAVVLSAWTIGQLNITSQNISTFCIYPQGSVVAATNNLAIINSVVPGICEPLQKGK